MWVCPFFEGTHFCGGFEGQPTGKPPFFFLHGAPLKKDTPTCFLARMQRKAIVEPSCACDPANCTLCNRRASHLLQVTRCLSAKMRKRSLPAMPALEVSINHRCRTCKLTGDTHRRAEERHGEPFQRLQPSQKPSASYQVGLIRLLRTCGVRARLRAPEVEAWSDGAVKLFGATAQGVPSTRAMFGDEPFANGASRNLVQGKIM